MLIGQLSKRSGATKRALRYYEQVGLLTSERQPNGFRSYPEDAVRRVAQIRGLLDAGFNSGTIGRLLPCVTGVRPQVQLCPRIAAEISQVLDQIDNRLKVLHTQRDLMTHLLAT